MCCFSSEYSVILSNILSKSKYSYKTWDCLGLILWFTYVRLIYNFDSIHARRSRIFIRPRPWVNTKNTYVLMFLLLLFVVYLDGDICNSDLDYSTCNIGCNVYFVEKYATMVEEL